MHRETPRQEKPRPEAPPEAAPLSEVTEHAEFRIILRGLELSPADEERIARAIRSALEQQLVALGHENKFIVTPIESGAQARPLLGESSRLIGVAVTGSKEE